MSRRNPNLPLFSEAADLVAGRAVPPVRPWRPRPADRWREDAPASPDAVEAETIPLLRRNLVFLRAMEIRGGDASVPEVLRFRERHEALVDLLVRWVAEHDRTKEAWARLVATVKQLADQRIGILAGLDTDRSGKVAAAEQRVRIRDVEIERGLSFARFELAAERRDLVTMEFTFTDPAATNLRPEVAAAIEAAFPDDVISPCWDDGELLNRELAVRKQLARLPDMDLLYEQHSGSELLDGRPDELDSEWSEDLDDYDEVQRSYALFFLSPRGEEYTCDTVGDTLDEDGRMVEVGGVGRIGLAVAVSRVADFALVRVTSFETDEAGGTSVPDIELCVVDDADQADAGEFLLATLKEEQQRRIQTVRRQITHRLETLGIEVLGEDEVLVPLPLLQADESVLAGVPGEPLTVEDALFFRML